MNKAVFLDRDGTINVEKNYLYKIEDFEFIPGVIESLQKLQKKGYLLIVVTNQSGIGRGLYTEQDFHVLNNWMVTFLRQNGVNISGVYFCPHILDAKVEKYKIDCECRKPKLGMYYKAIKDFNLDISRCYTIGDKLRDCAICASTKCKGILIGSNEDANIIQSVKEGNFKNVVYHSSFVEGINTILE